MTTDYMYVPKRASNRTPAAGGASAAKAWEAGSGSKFGRLVGVAGTFLVACLAIWAIAQAVPAVGIDGAPRWTYVTVQPGDSLWSIAVRAGDNRIDPRVLSERIRELNSIQGSVIRPGQSLKVPVNM